MGTNVCVGGSDSEEECSHLQCGGHVRLLHCRAEPNSTEPAVALRESTDKDRTAAVADALVEEIHLVAQHGK